MDPVGRGLWVRSAWARARGWTLCEITMNSMIYPTGYCQVSVCIVCSGLMQDDVSRRETLDWDAESGVSPLPQISPECRVTVITHVLSGVCLAAVRYFRYCYRRVRR